MNLNGDKISKGLSKIAGALELVMAGLVLVIIICMIIMHFTEVADLFSHEGDFNTAKKFLSDISFIIIAIEFMKMLCRPSPHNILETITFLIARHMIIDQSTPMENFLSTISIILLVFTELCIKQFQKNGTIKGLFRKREIKDNTESSNSPTDGEN